jgi:hypothetical protein
MKALRIIGFTDSVNECDYCGKTGLKGTFVMADDSNNEFYYGSSCGAKASGQTDLEFKESFKKITFDQKIEEMVKGATNEMNQDKVRIFAVKKGMSVLEFMKKFGQRTTDVVESYQFGSKTVVA